MTKLTQKGRTLLVEEAKILFGDALDKGYEEGDWTDADRWIRNIILSSIGEKGLRKLANKYGEKADFLIEGIEEKK